MTLYKLLLLTIALVLIAKAHYGLECTHDLEDHPEPQIYDIKEDMSALQNEGRMLASSYSNIRMHANYDLLDSAPSSFKAYIKNELAPVVIDWFQGALKVKYPVIGKLKIVQSNICDGATPSELMSGVSADYTIIFNHMSQPTLTVASSRACSTTSGVKRPLVGTTVFNRDQFKAANGDVLLHEKNIYLLIHEMMHTLGFSSSLYKNFVDSNGNTRKGHIKNVKLNGKTTTVIDVPPLTDKLRSYYGCSSLPGMYLENNGGDGTAGSHPERKIFLYETMCSGDIFGRRISEFTLALLEGSGWYVPNYEYAEPFFFGQGQGCGFITATSNTASKFDEYCTGSNRQCSNSGIGSGNCITDPNTNGLRYVNPIEDEICDNSNGENFARLPSLQVYGRGAGSKCFSGTLNTKHSDSPTTFCFRYFCSGSGSKTKLTVQVGKKNIICEKEDTITVDGYYGVINCPDPLHFCNTVGKKYCPRNCMGRGSCVNNKCVCKPGYSGIDCAKTN